MKCMSGDFFYRLLWRREKDGKKHLVVGDAAKVNRSMEVVKWLNYVYGGGHEIVYLEECNRNENGYLHVTRLY